MVTAFRDQGIIEKNIASIVYTLETDGSKLIFGGVPENAVPIATHEVPQEWEETWTFEMTDFKVDGKSIDGSDAVFGQLNPSQPGIMFNSDDYQVIRSKLLAVDPTAECDENKCSYLGQCTESLFE